MHTCWQLFGLLAGKGLHVHAKGQGYQGYSLSDIPQSDDSHRLASQFGQLRVPVAEVRILAPSAIAVQLGIVLRAVSYRQQVGKHHLCYAHSAVGRDIGHDNLSRLGSLDVDNIIPCGQHTDVAQPWQVFHHLAADDNLVGQHDVGVGGSRYGFFWPCAVVNDYLAEFLQRFPRKVAGVGCVAVEDNNSSLLFHILYHSL